MSEDVAASPSPATPPRAPIVGRIALLALVLYSGLVFSTIQSATPHIVDRDGYFHARYAALLPSRGLSREFPWAETTVLGKRFADKELAFHALMAPLAAWDPIKGAKALVIVLDGAIVLALAMALRSLGARAPEAFAATALACGSHFLFRASMARPHLLSLVLLVAGTAAVLRDRRRASFAIGFLYAWSYAAPHLLALVALCDAAARFLRAGTSSEERRAGLLTLAAASGGVLAGLVVNPYAPNSALLFWDQNVRVLGEAWGLLPSLGVTLGAEFQPVTTRSLLLTSPGALLLLAGGLLVAVAGPERPSRRTVSLLIATLAFLALTLLSAKAVELLAPFTVLFAASAVTDALAGRPFPRVATAAAAVALLALHGVAVGRTIEAARATPPPALEGAAGWIAANAKPGEKVVHLSWADFSTLFHFAPAQRYVVAMDPVFLALEDPEGARALEEMRAGRRPIDGAELSRRFGARLLVVDATREGPYEAAVRAGLEPLFEDGSGAVFRLPE